MSKDQNIIDNARLGYEVAAALWAYEGQVTWAAFNAMLVANSIVLAMEGFAQGIIKMVLPIFGIFLCIMWYSLTTRGFEVHNYRVLATRELEELYLAPTVTTVSRGGSFHGGEPVNLIINNKLLQRRLPLVARLLNGNQNVTFVILSFVLLHLMMLVDVLLNSNGPPHLVLSISLGT